MLNSIKDAASLKAIHEEIDAGLPRDYENYYINQMKSIKPSDRKQVSYVAIKPKWRQSYRASLTVTSVLLACIVHAKRPLRLDELCEATAAIDTESGKDINRSAKLFRNKVISLCQPLVNVQDSQSEHGIVSTCTLTHATVRNFLLKHPRILDDAATSDNVIAPIVMAQVCLAYLMQPRYNVPLRREGIDFRDKRDENIIDQHLLVYAAKYWDKHLDSVDYSAEMLDRVTRFLKSKQYYTCLQVQSLLVGGQFSFWYDAAAFWLGPHIKRVFPRWLQEHCKEDLQNQYRLFVSDWGLYLDEHANINGSSPGEIDRCFFGALGRENFLSTGPSRYKSFALKPDDKSIEQQLPTRIFDAISADGTEMIVFNLKQL
jgi:hypothetical protein